MRNLTRFDDKLSAVSRNISISEKIKLIHNEARKHYPQVDRVAVALYEKERDLLKTFASSCDDPKAISFYQSRLNDSPSLLSIVESGQPRIINDMDMLKGDPKEHSRRITAMGYGSSHTTPIFDDGQFTGFIFLNSYKKNAFLENTCAGLAPFVHLVGMLTLKELGLTKVLFGSVATALDISHHRDPETGAHLERMSRYARIIATHLAPGAGLDDEFVEYLYRFAPLHDIGKISLPDTILLKPGKLDEDEFNEMKKHTTKGRVIMERMLSNFNLHGMKHVDLLMNIVELHHECIDGSGYPRGLKGDNVPLEARIIAVADIFDALTSERPYKNAWSNKEACTELESMAAQGKLDHECVAALTKNMEQILQIQATFDGDLFG